jgi:hypothetical protein
MVKSTLIIIAIFLIILGIFINFIPIISFYLVEYPKFPLNGITKGAYFDYHLIVSFGVSNTTDFVRITCNKPPTLNVTYLGNGEYNVSILGTYHIAINAIEGPTLESKNVTIDYHAVLPSTSPLIKALFITNPNSLIATVGNCSIQMCANPRAFEGFFCSKLLNPCIVKPHQVWLGYSILQIGYLVLANNQKALDYIGYGGPYPVPPYKNLSTLADEYANLLIATLNQTSLHNYLNSKEYKLGSISIHVSLICTNVKPAENIIGDLTWNLTVEFFPLNFSLIIIGIILIIVYVRKRQR